MHLDAAPAARLFCGERGYVYNQPDYYYVPQPDYYYEPDPYEYYPPQPDYYPPPPDGISQFFGLL